MPRQTRVAIDKALRPEEQRDRGGPRHGVQAVHSLESRQGQGTKADRLGFWHAIDERTARKRLGRIAPLRAAPGVQSQDHPFVRHVRT